MDFNALWQYDSLAIKAAVYELYFDWTLKRPKEEEKKKQKDEEKKKGSDGVENKGEQNENSRDKNKEVKQEVISNDD